MEYNWVRYDTEQLPPENTRILVSDSDNIAVARYIRGDNQLIWFFDNDAYKDMQFIWWAELPKLPPKVVSSSENNN